MRLQRCAVVLAAALACVALPASAQQGTSQGSGAQGSNGAQMQMPGMAGSEKHDAAKAEPPAILFAGLGSLHHPIQTSNPEAQRFFDQGLTLVYAFNHEEAVRSFKRAAELDPHAAMPYWGVALASGPNYNSDVDPEREKASYDAIHKAMEIGVASPPNERDYIDALAMRYTNDPKADLSKLANDYAAAMRDLSRRYPDDPDASTLFAESLMDLHPWMLWANDGKPGPDTVEIVSVLEGVLRKWPNHAGANHFYIHAMEASPHPEAALPSAQRLETMVPAAGHLVHMPAHIYIRTGDYAGAVKSNVDAVETDKVYLRERQITNATYVLGYTNHNLHFLAAAANMDGDYATAYKAANDLATAARAAVKDMSGAEAFLPMPIVVELRFARWDDVLALPKPDTQLAGLTFFWHYARACAFVAKGQADRAQAERDAMEQVYKGLTPGPAFGMMYNDWTTLHDVAEHSLAARIAASQGDSAGAVEHWRAAAAVQDQMRYDEPADWYYPVRESLGAALLRAGQAEDAEKVFREDLVKNPRNPRSLFGLGKALEAQKKNADAAWVRSSFQAAWKGEAGALRIEDF
jgi:tetratricopeptide (TPR) repeat protein